ncbi:hypothetical protein Bbelb_268280 [Branchiostoma belcheri]|nr:hypothetical protein Bbelb_268280 [Branchiostoma belcheri]
MFSVKVGILLRLKEPRAYGTRGPLKQLEEPSHSKSWLRAFRPYVYTTSTPLSAIKHAGIYKVPRAFPATGISCLHPTGDVIPCTRLLSIFSAVVWRSGSVLGSEPKGPGFESYLLTDPLHDSPHVTQMNHRLVSTWDLIPKFIVIPCGDPSSLVVLQLTVFACVRILHGASHPDCSPSELYLADGFVTFIRRPTRHITSRKFVDRGYVHEPGWSRAAPVEVEEPARDLTAARPNCKSRSTPYHTPHGSRRATDRAPDGSLTETGRKIRRTLGVMTPAGVYTEDMPNGRRFKSQGVVGSCGAAVARSALDLEVPTHVTDLLHEFPHFTQV